MTLVPWVTLLTPPLREARGPWVVNAQGDEVEGWLCPSAAEARAYAARLVEDVLAESGASSILVDRLRFPEWGPRGLTDALSCFCGDCIEAARRAEVPIEPAREQLLALHALLSRDPEAFIARVGSATGQGLRPLLAEERWAPVSRLLRFRDEQVLGLVEQVEAAAAKRSAALWLDVWPPSYGWLMGQDLGALGRLATVVRPFTYHRWGGGVDVASLIGQLGPDPVQQRAYEAFLSLFRFPAPRGFGDFRRLGLDPEFVRSELELTRRLSPPGAQLSAGLQICNIERSSMIEGLERAAAAGVDGLMLYCYGWATHDQLQAAGEWIRRRQGR